MNGPEPDVTPRHTRLTRLLGRAACVLMLLGAPSCAKDRPEPDSPGDDPADTSGPDAELEQICAHNYEVLIVPTGVASPGVRSDFMTNCVAGAEAKREELGESAWSSRLSCVLAGQTPADLGRCDGREPPAPRDVSTEPEITYAALCDHVIGLMVKEYGDVLIPAAGLPELKSDCVDNFEQSNKDDPAKFVRQARCILGLTSLEDFERCQD